MNFEASEPDARIDISGTMKLYRSLGVEYTSSLTSFLERPIRIRTDDWTIGGDLLFNFNPWSSFLQSNAISEKIEHFSRLRGKMHVRFVINGNAFYAGRAIATYVPFYDGSATGTVLPRSITGPTSFDFHEICQRPKVFIDPNTSQSKEMVLPFFHYKDWYDLQNEPAENLGTIALATLNPLTHGNGSLAPVTLSIFLWMTEVELCVPTTYEQVSKKIGKDEYGDGALSTTLEAAATISNVMAEYSSGPVSTSFRAAGAGLELGRDVAKKFGYSKPDNISSVNYYKPMPVGRIGVTDDEDTSEKTTITSKQEVIMDPSVVGLSPEDELTIQHLCSKTGYLYTFDWSASDNVDDVLFSTAVGPRYWFPNGTQIHFTPIGYFSDMFRSWRGSIVYTFQMVANSYQKGRLRLTWDPNIFVPGADMNTAYTTILDLDTEREVDFVVPWLSDYPYNDMTSYHRQAIAGDLRAPVIGTDNGTVNVLVLNKLTSPSDVVSSMSVNVYVRCGEDFELANPASETLQMRSFFSQVALDISGVEENKPDVPVEPMHGVDNSLYLENFGESCLSLRTLLKRFIYTRATKFVENSPQPWHMSSWTMSDFPYYMGYDPANPLSETTGFTSVFNTYLNLVSPCFVARRGGIRWKYLFMDSSTANHRTITTVSRDAWPSGYTHRQIDDTNDTYFNANCLRTPFYPNGMRGAAVTVNSDRSTLEVELPYHSHTKFFKTNDLSALQNGEYIKGRSHTLQFTSLSTTAEVADEVRGFVSYVAAADDFNLMFFVSTPILHSYEPPIV